MALFDWLKRGRGDAPVALAWHVYRAGGDLVADDSRGGTFRVALSGAKSVRIVPLTGGNQHGGARMGGYQVAIQRHDGDAPIGKPTQDWRPARELARQVCDVSELPLDEITERMFSRVGQFARSRTPEMERVRRAKIVATLGPATDGLELELVRAGLDVARLNFSHGIASEHARRCAAVRQAAASLGRQVAVMQDLQGPKIRVGSLVGGGPVRLEVGRELHITRDDILGTAERIGCTYQHLADDVQPGDRVLLDDGRIRLSVLAVRNGEVTTRVEAGGPLGEHKGINLPGVAVSAPAITDKDRIDLAFGLQELQVDYVALSFIRTAQEVRAAQELMRSLGHTVPCIVKLEKGEAIDNLDAIMQVADGVMVARGDLGVELAPEQVPMLQKRIIQRANHRGIPVITATQMLESMITEETPTRAEASDVANAVWDGSDAVMLSAETATGRYRLVVLGMMDRIVRTAESAEEPHIGRNRDDRPRGYAAAVTHAARVLAEDLDASAIVGITRSGLTAELLSRGRARVPIFAFSPDANVCRRLALWWGIMPVQLNLADALEPNIVAMEDHLVRSHAAAPADTVVICGSHPFEVGVHTNFVKYHVLGGKG